MFSNCFFYIQLTLYNMVFVLNLAALTMGVVMISDDTVPSVNKHDTLKERRTTADATDDKKGMMDKAKPVLEGLYDVGTLGLAGAAVANTDPLTGGAAMAAGSLTQKGVEWAGTDKDGNLNKWVGYGAKAAVPAVAFGTVQGMNMMNEGAAAAPAGEEGDKPEDHQSEEGHAADEEPAKED